MIGQVLTDGLIAGASYGLFALGFALVFRVCKFFHLGHGAMYSAGPYCAYVLINICQCSSFVAIPIAIGFTACLGMGIEMGVYRPLRRRRSARLVFLLVSLGVYIVIQNCTSIIFGDSPLRLRTGDITEGISLFGLARITYVQLTTVIIFVTLSVATWLYLRYSLFGTTIRALAIDPELSVVVGIDGNRTFLVTIGIASALAAVAGLLTGYDTDLVPDMGFTALLIGSAAMILGGLESTWGALFGGLAVAMVQHASVVLLPSKWQDASIFAVMIAILILRPRGIIGAQAPAARN